MSYLPESWDEAKIVELLTLNENGKPFQQGWSPQCKPEPSKESEWGVLKTTAIQQGQFWAHENKALPEHLEPRMHLEVKVGDVLMTCAGPRNRCGIVCFVKNTPPKLMMSGKMYRFRPNLEVLNSRYLEAFITTHQAQLIIDAMKTGINDSGLNLTHSRFAELTVPLAPLDEQNRIVAKIEELFSELDNGIESLKKAREQLKVYRQAVLKHAFEGKLTAKWREENKDKLESPKQLLARIQQERDAHYQQQLVDWKVALKDWEQLGKNGKKPSKPKQLNLENLVGSNDDGLPLGWTAVPLGSLVSGINQGWSPKCESRATNDDEWGVIKTTAVQHGKFHEIENKALPDSYVPRIQHKLNVGDILVTRAGPRVRVGVCCLIRGVSKNLMNCDKVYRIHALERICRPDYIEAVLNSPKLLNDLEKIKSGINDSGVNLNQNAFLQLKIPLCSISEQNLLMQEVEQNISVLKKQEETINILLKQSEALRQSILKRAFSGKLVTQDSSDEPAEKLLERISTYKNKARA